jgi:Na(+)-translocating NADH:ubiquinone oxidoreductase A subunit
MKFRGGYSVTLQGKPSGDVKILPEPEALYLPLKSKRFEFSNIFVKEGQKVDTGDILAVDPGNFEIPLLSPRAGTVRLSATEGHIVLEDISKVDDVIDYDKDNIPHILKKMGVDGEPRHKLLSLGAWQFFSDAYTGEVPDPMATPQAVIISTLSLEPFSTRGDVQLKSRLLQFTRGLEYLQSLLEYQPIYLVMPKLESEFANKVKEQIRGYAWAKLVEVPLEYTRDNFNILARHIGLKRSDGPIWSIRTEGILAVDRALTHAKASLVRIVSVAGPGVNNPEHVKVISGYPIDKIKQQYALEGQMRVIGGGFFTGDTLGEDNPGLNSECSSILIMPEHTKREFLGWLRPGFDRSSYSNSFLSAFCRGCEKFTEKFTTAVRGEVRACVSCNYCEEVCPAGIMPHLIHKYLYSEMVEEADAARVDLCVECGLCSFVCPSKIELRQEFIDAKVFIEEEKAEAEALRVKQEESLQKEQERRKESSEENLY